MEAIVTIIIGDTFLIVMILLMLFNAIISLVRGIKAESRERQLDLFMGAVGLSLAVGFVVSQFTNLPTYIEFVLRIIVAVLVLCIAKRNIAALRHGY